MKWAISPVLSDQVIYLFRCVSNKWKFIWQIVKIHKWNVCRSKIPVVCYDAIYTNFFPKMTTHFRHSNDELILKSPIIIIIVNHCSVPIPVYCKEYWECRKFYSTTSSGSIVKILEQNNRFWITGRLEPSILGTFLLCPEQCLNEYQIVLKIMLWKSLELTVLLQYISVPDCCIRVSDFSMTVSPNNQPRDSIVTVTVKIIVFLGILIQNSVIMCTVLIYCSNFGAHITRYCIMLEITLACLVQAYMCCNYPFHIIMKVMLYSYNSKIHN